MNGKKIVLVTGGAGYIGSVVCQFLNKKKHNVIIIDDLRDGNAEAISSDCVFYKSDFGDISILRKIFQKYKIDFVFHFAASANVPDSVQNPLKYYDNNVVNTINLLKIMLEFDVKKIIFSSTAAVYGEPEYTPIDEKHVLKPVNPYGRSKLMVENILADFSYAYSLDYIIFRYFCAAGATKEHGESRKLETHLIPIVLDQALRKIKAVTIFGNDYKTPDGTGIRDFLHVEDIANAHILGMEKFGSAKNKIINLGNGVGYSVEEIIKNSEKYLNCNIEYNFGKKREGDPAVLIASHQEAKKYLGWHPSKTIKDILLSSYKWRKNPKY